MRFEQLVRWFGGWGWFDLAAVAQVSGEAKPVLRTQMHRWIKAGKVLPLRRGMYAIAGEFRRGEVHPGELANRLQAPSYLSLHWALGYYGLIPEKVVVFTSVTPRQPRRFENAFGVFQYRHVKRDAFFGSASLEMNGHKVLVARPEKALLDLWHLESGAWDLERMREMRFQNVELVDPEALRRDAVRFSSKRLEAAVETWMQFAEQETQHTIEL
jgi:hypothetical protein